MRILITGMGGELGTAVARRVEGLDGVEATVGIDLHPPRRLLRRAVFHRVDPRDRDRVEAVVREVAPTALVHLGVYEPYSRSSPRSAVARTATGTVSAVPAAVAAGSLDRIVLRSGVEVYGRRRNSPDLPDEDVRPDPTCSFGHSLAHVEQICVGAGRRAGLPVTALRFAPIVGAHVPSPLGRLLRLPLVPVGCWWGPRFSVVHQSDVVEAVVAALRSPFDGPVNVAGPGDLSVAEAARAGGRIPVPVVGPGWRGARAVAELAGAPVPDHVQELLVKGRRCDGGRLRERLDMAEPRSTRQVVEELYEWSGEEWLAGDAAAA